MRRDGDRRSGGRELIPSLSRGRELLRRLLSSEFFRQISHTLATRVLLLPLGVLSSVIVTRALGPEGRGELAVATTLAALAVQFSNFGLHTSNTFVVARRPELLGAVTGNALAASATLGTLMALALWAIASLLPRLAPVDGRLLALCLLWVPLGLAYLLVQNLLIAIQEVRTSNRVEILQRVVAIALVVLVISLGWATSVSVFATSLIALLASLAALLVRLGRRLGTLPRPDAGLLRENLGYGLKSYFTSLCAYLMLRIDLLMVQYLRGPAEVGYYSVAVSMADLVYMIPSTVGALLFPRLSAMPSRGEQWRAARRMTLLMLAVLIPIALVASGAAPWITRLLFGEPFLPAVPAFVWLMPGIVAYGSAFASTFLMGVGLPAAVLGLWAAFVAMNVALNAALIPRLGFVGASISSSITYTTAFVALTLYARRLARGEAARERP